MEINSNINNYYAVLRQCVKATSQEVEQVQKTQQLSEADKLENFKKEIWNEINSLPWDSRMNISIQITDKAFERMMKDDKFKDKMMGLIREESLAAHPPGDTSLTWIDENGYKGYAYLDIESGHSAFKAHSNGKDNFYVKKSKKDELNKLWEKEHQKKAQQKEIQDEDYEKSLQLKNVFKHKEEVAKLYEEKSINQSKSDV